MVKHSPNHHLRLLGIGTEGVGEQRRFFAPLVNGALPRANFDERVTAFLEEVWQPQKL